METTKVNSPANTASRVEEAYGVSISELPNTFSDDPYGEIQYRNAGVIIVPETNVHQLDDTDKSAALKSIIKQLVICADECRGERNKEFRRYGHKPMPAEAADLIAQNLSQELTEGEEFWRPKSFEEEGSYASVKLGTMPFATYKGHELDRWLGGDSLSIRLLNSGEILASGFGGASELRERLPSHNEEGVMVLRVTEEQPTRVPSMYITNGSPKVRLDIAKLNQLMVEVACNHDLAITPLHSVTQVFSENRAGGIDDVVSNIALHGAMRDPEDKTIGLKLEIAGHTYMEKKDKETLPSGSLWAEFVPVSEDESVVLPRIGGRVKDGDICIRSGFGALDKHPEVDNIESQYHHFLMTYAARKITEATAELFESFAGHLIPESEVRHGRVIVPASTHT